MKFSSSVLLAAILFAASSAALAQQLSADDIIAKSIAAVGTVDARSKTRNLTAIGEASAIVVASGVAPNMGKVAFASEGKKTLLAMTFPTPNYPLEKITFDGSDLKVGYITPGHRSSLGDYLYRYDLLMKQGLLGGVLRSDWILLNAGSAEGKFSYSGTKKLDGRDTYVITYEPKKAEGVTIHLFFDKETFQHVRTEYRKTTSASMGATVNESASQMEGHDDLTEQFSDFKSEKGLTLPRTDKLSLHLEDKGRSSDYVYTLKYQDLYYNSQLDPATFLQ